MSKELTTVDALKKDIQRLEPQFQLALPAHIPAKKFSRVIMTAISNSPGLAEASKQSLFSSCMKLAEMGLLPDNKEAAIITFNSKAGKVAKEMPMTQGLLKLVRNSGQLASYTTNVVCKEDKFEYWVDSDGENLEHTPNMFADRGEVIGVYGLARTKDGAVYIEVMNVSEVEKVRSSSRSAESGPWKTWWNEMAKKTVFRRLYKRLPSSTDLDNAMEAEDSLYNAPVEEPREVAPEKEVKALSETKPKKKKKSRKLQEAIDVTPKKVEEETEEDEPLPNFAPSSQAAPPQMAEEDMPI